MNDACRSIYLIAEHLKHIERLPNLHRPMVLHALQPTVLFPVHCNNPLQYVASFEHRWQSPPASKAKLSRSRCRCQASPETEPPDDEVSVKGDWREFRASLVSTEQGERIGPHSAGVHVSCNLWLMMDALPAAPEGGDVWSTRWCQENLHLLQQQVWTVMHGRAQSCSTRQV